LVVKRLGGDAFDQVIHPLEVNVRGPALVIARSPATLRQPCAGGSTAAIIQRVLFRWTPNPVTSELGYVDVWIARLAQATRGDNSLAPSDRAFESHQRRGAVRMRPCSARGRRREAAGRDRSADRVNADNACRGFDEGIRGGALVAFVGQSREDGRDGAVGGQGGGATEAVGAHPPELEPGTQRDLDGLRALEGELVLVEDEGATVLRPGDAAGWPAGVRDGHHLQNRSDREAAFLVVGTRDPRDHGEYADIDMVFAVGRYGGDKSTVFRHKDGTQYS
jgi:hypothetical protein